MDNQENAGPNSMSFVTTSSLWPPRLISELSAWNQHVPFAGWVIEATEPRVFVELGSHAGVSYFAFCESVARHDLGTQCFAVDTWVGDEHAGFYDDDVYLAVQKTNSDYYEAFSRLMRTTFDDASEEFADGSIDLLHLDGLHTYEAVRHDFETWLPKLSDRAVVLLHDTNERKDDFGVHRLLAELRQHYPVFEFTHEHGLGVVCIGENVPPPIADLVALENDPPRVAAVRALYEALGRRHTAELQQSLSASALAQRGRELADLNAAIERRDSEIANLNTAVNHRNDQLEDLGAAIARRDNQIADLSAAVERRDSEIANLNTAVNHRNDRLEDLGATIAHRDNQIAKEEQRLSERDRQITDLETAAHQRANELAELRAKDQQQESQVARLTASLEKRNRLLADARRKNTEARNSLSRLRARRSVRIALAFSALFRPLFHLIRRARKSMRRAPSDTTAANRTSAKPAIAKEVAPAVTVPPPRKLLPQAGSESGPVTVIVPIYNAPQELERCLGALVSNTTGASKLLLIDDASTDDRIQPILDEYSLLENVTVLRNDVNLGFVKTVNRGFAESTGDVVLLNSDVRVSPRWLDRLRLAARSVPDAGSITPLSDNAGAFSAPQIGAKNDLPPSLTEDEIGRLVAQRSERTYPHGPTGNGFCMYIRRACIDDVGLFDDEAFPRGYGEENDFCMRAIAKGWKHIVDDSTYVFHSRSASFGDEKHALAAAGRKVIDARYPEYGALVREFVSSPRLLSAQARIAATFAEAETHEVQPRPRVLFVLHSAGGGTPATTRDLVRGLAGTYEAFVLVSDGRALTLTRYDEEPVEVDRWPLQQPIQVQDTTNLEYRNIVQSVLIDHQIEIVHIRHLIGHTFELPSIAKSLGVPVVLSFHDFYYVCPTVHLMDEKDRFCGGECSAGQGTCPIPTPWLEGLPHLKHAWVYDWRKRSLEMFGDVAAFITASESTRATYIRVFPELASRRFEVIEHGRDLATSLSPSGEEPSADGPIRILLPGNIAPHKGSIFVQKLSAIDQGRRLEFHVLGKVGDELDGTVTVHGTYKRADFEERARAIRPSFVGIFSTTAESFSHVLTEAWAAGIPVLASRLGALEDRVERDGGGWLIDTDDPAGTYQRILEVAADRQEYKAQRDLAVAAAEKSRSVADMAFDYAGVYGRLSQERKPLRDNDDSSVDNHPLRLGVFLPAASIDQVNPSGHIRILRRLVNLSVAGTAVWKLLDCDSFVEGGHKGSEIDVAVVQRTAIPSSSVDAFVAKCTSEGIGVVYDIDDDLLSQDPDWQEREIYGAFRKSIETLAATAETVTVSTSTLADHLSDLSDRIVVVENALDRSLWLQPIDPDVQEAYGNLQLPNPEALKILFVGGPSHAGDLEILRSTIETKRDQSGRGVDLYVVGGTKPAEREGWYRAIDIPSDRRYYPRFVEWIRSIGGLFDIGVGPLADTRLNSSKSDLRFLEYTALGLPGIYSRGPAFSSIEDGKTGLVVANDPDAWSGAIDLLLSDKDLRQRLQRNALEYVLSERLIGGPQDEFRRCLVSASRQRTRTS